MTRQWTDYDVSGMGAFLTDLANWRPVVSAPAPLPEPEPVDPVVEVPAVLGTPQEARVLVTSLNIRNRPTLKSSVMGSLPRGSVVSAYPDTEVSADGYQWVYMDALGLTGWMANKAGEYFEWVDPTPPVVPDVPPIDPYREILAVLHDTPLLNVRESPTTKAPIGAEIKPGALIGYVWPPVTGEDIGGGRGNLWVKVRVDGTTGYAHKFYLTLPEDAPTPIPEPPPADDDTADVPVPPVTRVEYEAALARIEALEEVIARLKVALAA